MTKQSRRDFVATTLAGGALALAPWNRVLAEMAETQTATDDPLALAVARWGGDPVSEEELAGVAKRLTQEAINALGGMQRFVSKGDVVWVKPNIGWDRTPEQAANTNPDVVSTLIEMCFDAGAKTVKVGDHPCNDHRASYNNSGIAGATERAGGQVVYLDPNRYREMEVGGERLKTWEIYPEIVECDLVINVPIAKHHGLSKATLCMKNYMGVIGGARHTWHQDLPTCLADITAFMKPRLSVLDAVRILTANGPQGGNLDDVKRLDTVAAGTDIVALDALGGELMGHEIGELDTITAGHERGLGSMHYKQLPHRSINLS